jgi:hypothetical protein
MKWVMMFSPITFSFVFFSFQNLWSQHHQIKVYIIQSCDGFGGSNVALLDGFIQPKVGKNYFFGGLEYGLWVEPVGEFKALIWKQFPINYVSK